MKKIILITGISIFIVGLFISCEKKGEESLDYGQSFTFEYKDNTPLVGAEVELKFQNFLNETFATGTTDENGTVYFSNETLQSSGFEMPYDFVLYAKKGFYSNIQNLAVYDMYNGEVNQNRKYLVQLSLAEALLDPIKWVYANSYHGDSLITDYVAECSKDNYLEVVTGIDPNDNNSIVFIGMDGDLVCNDPFNFYPTIPISSFMSSNVVIEDNNTLPSGSIDNVNSYDVESLEISNDTLYFMNWNGDNTVAYVPIF